jgi:hypothetical protein
VSTGLSPLSPNRLLLRMIVSKKSEQSAIANSVF